MNGIPLINGMEYCWADISVLIAGTPVTGITGIEYNDDEEVTDIYGAGRYPVARSKGRITCTGKITLLSTEINALVKKAQRTAYEPELTTKVTVAGQTITLVIRDNGIGIEDTIINKIFDPFFTTKTTGEAAGVGLYLTHEVIQNYGGNISVKSVKDEFCEFTITLPTIKK